MAEEPRCPECDVVVLEGWDWCHGCGYDPDGLRPPSAPREAPVAAPPTGDLARPPVATPVPPATAGFTAPPTTGFAPPPSAGSAPPPTTGFTAPPNAGYAPPPAGPQLPAPPGRAGGSGQSSSAAPIVAAMAVVALVVVVGIVATLLVTRGSEPTDEATGPAARPTTTAPPTSAPASPSPVATSPTPPAATTPAAMTPAAMFASPADPGAVIDVPSAISVVKAFWPVHLDGWSRADAATVALVETGAARDWDSNACQPACTTTYGPMIGAPVVTAPPQTGYPASFAAQIQVPLVGTDGDGRPAQGIDTYIVVFTRASAEEPWLAALIVGNGGSSTVLAPNRSVSAMAAPPAITGPIDPRRLPDDLAAYFQAYRYTGAAPADTPFKDNGASAQDGTQAWVAHERLLEMGITDVGEYRSGAPGDGYFEFAADPSTMLVCSTIRWTTVNESQTPGGVVTVTDPDMFQAFIPLGEYTRIERDGVRQGCFTLSTDCTCLSIVGLIGGPYQGRTEAP